MTGRRTTEGRWYVDRFLTVWESGGNQTAEQGIDSTYREAWIKAVTPYLPHAQAGMNWQPAEGLLRAIDSLPGGAAVMESLIAQSEVLFRLQLGLRTGCVTYHYVRTLPQAAVNDDLGEMDLERRLVTEAAEGEQQINFLRFFEYQLHFLAADSPKRPLPPELEQLWHSATLQPEHARNLAYLDAAFAQGFELMSCNVSWKLFYREPHRCFVRGKSTVYEESIALETAARALFPPEGPDYASTRNAWRWHVRQLLLLSKKSHPGLEQVMQTLELLWKPAALTDASRMLMKAYWNEPGISQAQAYARIRLMLRHGGRVSRAVTAETHKAVAALDALLASHMSGEADPALSQQRQKEHVRLLDMLLRRGMAAAFAEMQELEADALLEKLGQALFHDVQALDSATLPSPVETHLVVAPQFKNS